MLLDSQSHSRSARVVAGEMEWTRPPRGAREVRWSLALTPSHPFVYTPPHPPIAEAMGPTLSPARGGAGASDDPSGLIAQVNIRSHPADSCLLAAAGLCVATITIGLRICPLVSATR